MVMLARDRLYQSDPVSRPCQSGPVSRALSVGANRHLAKHPQRKDKHQRKADNKEQSDRRIHDEPPVECDLCRLYLPCLAAQDENRSHAKPKQGRSIGANL